MILRYENEAREMIDSRERALDVRRMRVDDQGTWRHVGEACQERWTTSVGEGDTQSLGATLCHIAAEILGEDPDSAPWS